MPHTASDLACRLAANAEAVCQSYLSSGRRQGRYWVVGDIHNTPGRSLFVRLHGPGSGPGAAGKWTDAATGQHGDLLDIIRQRCGLAHFMDAAEEARQFLSLPISGSHRNAQATARDYRPSTEGEHVSGIYRQRVNLSSGRFAMIDNGLGFQLVPWRPALEQQIGKQVAGVVSLGGGVRWDFGRKQALGL